MAGLASRCQMMTRMERATATRALSLPRRLTMRPPVAFAEEGVGLGGRETVRFPT
jgi:hypothetical protein